MSLRFICVACLAAWVFSGALPAQESLRTAHVFVALADNEHQGIVPVPAKLGNGEDPEHNLYWGSAYGVKTYFSRSEEWKKIRCGEKPNPEILERCIFQHSASAVYLVADAYRGSQIRQAVVDFLEAAAGKSAVLEVPSASGELKLPIAGSASLIAYVGHDGLMDFQLSPLPPPKEREPSRRGNPCLRQQTVLFGGGPNIWRISSSIDDGIDGARGIHLEKRSRWLDCRRK